LTEGARPSEATSVVRQKQERLRSDFSRVFIGLGSNLGDRHGFIEIALSALGNLETTSLLSVSNIRETAAFGGPEQGPYLNAVALLKTRLDPHRLLDQLLQIERDNGRIREVRWGPRTLDLDLLIYGEERIDSELLTVPHPRIQDRSFVLEPLLELDAQWRHPVLGGTALELLDRLRNPVPTKSEDCDGP
jgi:2-amino-4-hydroxy-6-hydroxymethyldihydropteridine diphosphokinase